MPFALTNDPSQADISEAINYLLANFGPNLSADPNTGQITGPSGIVIAYLYRYLSVKYADSFDGSLNFSNSPTGRSYYGVNNSNSTTESTNPADYIWYKVAGGFSTTKFLFYQTTGGRSINFVVATTAPSDSYVQDAGTAIDLDILTSGAKANSATTAYLVQSQSSPAPSGFPLYTSGSSLPPGWSATIGTVAVGQVVWYSFGQYNGSSSTVNGIPANSTYWSTPVAASVFQDIRSDNWNGSTPPTYGTPSTYGTAGYYISRTTGNVYFNNGVFRADISTNGDAVFKGDNPTTSNIPVYDSIYYIDYSTLGDGTTTASLGNARAGVLGTAISSGSIWNAGVVGYGVIPSGVSGGVGIGVVGSSNDIGGYFSSYLSTGVGLVASGSSTTARAFQINQGRFVWGSYSIAQPTGSTSTFLRNDGQWATPSSSGGVTSLATSNSSSGLTLSASSSTGAVTLTLAGTPTNATNAVYSSYLGGVADSGWARIFPTNSGTANAAGAGLNLLGSASTGIAGAYVGTSGSGNTVTFGVQTTSPSDVRLKEEIANSDLGLAFVKQLRPVSYKLKADPKHQKGYGFIADEVEALIGGESSLVYFEKDWQVGDEKGFKTIHYPSYIAVLTKAIQELSAEVEALKAQLKV